MIIGKRRQWKVIFFIFLISFIVTLCFVPKATLSGIKVEFMSQSDIPIDYQLFYKIDKTDGFSEDNSLHLISKGSKKYESIVFIIPVNHVEGVRLDVGVSPGNVKIGKLEINGKSIEVSKAFILENMNQIYNVQYGKKGIYFTSTQNDPFIVFSKECSVWNKTVFYNWVFLFSIFILVFILLFILVSLILYYIKGIDKLNGFDIVFVIMFFVIIILPICKMNTAEIDIVEKRKLAVFPPIRIDNQINLQFSKQFETWLNDRFYGRHKFIALYDELRLLMQLGHYENAKAFQGTSGWLFYKMDNSVELYQNRKPFSEEECNVILNNLKLRNEWFFGHGMKYYLFVEPNKSDIYGEYYLPNINKKKGPDRIELLEDYLNDNGYGNYLYYSKKMLLNHKNEGLLYIKPDTHWSELGAYWGYQMIMEILLKDFKNIGYLSDKDIEMTLENNHQIGDLSQMLTINNNNLYDDSYFVPRPVGGYHYSVVKVEGKENKSSSYRVITKNPNKNLKVIVYRDSFFNAVIPYFSESFGEVEYIWDYTLDKDFILEEKPDLVIQEMVSRFTDSLLQQ